MRMRYRIGTGLGGALIAVTMLIPGVVMAQERRDGARIEERREPERRGPEHREIERRERSDWRFERGHGWRFERMPGVWSPYYAWWLVNGQRVMLAAPPATVVSYPSGRYELRGDGVTVPYQWVWVPTQTTLAPPPPPIPPPPPGEMPAPPPPPGG
jgi:hypothetical protein